MKTQDAIECLDMLTIVDAPKLREAIDMAIKALESQESAYAEGYTYAESKYRKALDELPRWIPCKERLPENDGYYLATGGKECFVAELKSAFGIKGWIYPLPKLPIIEAWMPLPEPYTEE